MFTSLDIALTQTISYIYPISFTTCWNAVCSTATLGLMSRIQARSTSGAVALGKINGDGTSTNVSIIIIGY